MVFFLMEMRFRTPSCIQNEGPSVHFDASQFDGDDLSGVLLTHPYVMTDDYVEDFSVRFVDYSRGIRRDNSSNSSGAGRQHLEGIAVQRVHQPGQ